MSKRGGRKFGRASALVIVERGINFICTNVLGKVQLAKLLANSNPRPSVTLAPMPRRAFALSSARFRVTNDLEME